MPSETRRIGLPPARASLPSSFRTVGKTPSTNVQNWRIVSLLLFIRKKVRATQPATMSKSKCFKGLVGGHEKEMNNCWECEITWNRALFPIRSSHIVAQPPLLFLLFTCVVCESLTVSFAIWIPLWSFWPFRWSVPQGYPLRLYWNRWPFYFRFESSWIRLFYFGCFYLLGNQV